jgi:hypothetical protein
MTGLFGITPYEVTMEALSAYVLTEKDTAKMAMAAEALRVMEEDGKYLRPVLDSEFIGLGELRDFAEVGG